MEPCDGSIRVATERCRRPSLARAASCSRDSFVPGLSQDALSFQSFVVAFLVAKTLSFQSFVFLVVGCEQRRLVDKLLWLILLSMSYRVEVLRLIFCTIHATVNGQADLLYIADEQGPCLHGGALAMPLLKWTRERQRTCGRTERYVMARRWRGKCVKSISI
jgi:hypothetical protein